MAKANEANDGAASNDSHEPGALLARSHAGDHEALTLLLRLTYGPHHPTATDHLMEFARTYLVKATLRHRRSPDANPESMAQQGVLRILTALPQLEELTASCFLAYLDRMAHNWSIDQERKRHRHKETTLGGDSAGHHKPSPAAPAALPPVVSQERLEFLLSCCAAEDERQLLRWRFADDRSYAEIGAMFVPPRREDTVRMQIARLLVRLGEDARVRREWER